MTTTTTTEGAGLRAGHPTASRQVSWWPCHEFIAAVVSQANCGPLPVAGTPSWAALADDDPAKLLALAAAGEHHVLRMETAQQARADAARAISGSTSWSQVAREIQQRANARETGARIERKAAS